MGRATVDGELTQISANDLFFLATSAALIFIFFAFFFSSRRDRTNVGHRSVAVLKVGTLARLHGYILSKTLDDGIFGTHDRR